MKTRKLLFILFFWIGLSGLHAQNMYVRPTSGSQTSYAIANIQKLTFFGGELLVTPISGTVGTHNLVGNRYLNFSDLTLGAVAQQTKPTALYLYPNPVKDILHFANANQNQTIDAVEIISLAGRLFLQQKQTKNALSELDVSTLPQGMYLCKIKSGGNIQTFKFLKQ
jgi:hypothetical protein